MISRGGKSSYRLSSRLYKVFQKQMSYFRDRGLEARRQRALILEVAEELEGLTLDDAQELCGTDRAAAQSLLRRLVREGQLTSTRQADGVRVYRLPEDV